MSLRSQILIIILALLAICAIISKIKKNKLELKYALGWIFLCIIVVILSIFPKLLDIASTALGIDLPINMLFFIGFCLALIIIFMLTIIVSNLSNKVKTLTQEIAIIKNEFDKLRSK